MFCVILYKIGILHIVEVHNEKTLREKGISQTIKTVKLKAYRGSIVDRNGEIIALTVPLKNIIIDPELLNKQLYIKVANALNMDIAEFTNSINNSTSRKYLKIKQNLTLDDPILKNIDKFIQTGHEIILENNQITKKYIGGAIILEDDAKRYYPQANSSAPLIGLTDKYNNGISGIEKSYNDTLAGKDGKKLMAFAGKQVYADVKMITPAQQGQTIELTIDNNIQYFTYQAVKESVDRYSADYGSAIVLSPDGNILAMVDYPSANPNNRSKYQAKNYRNRVLANRLEPGSTMKPFIALLALNNNKIKVGEKIAVSTTIANHKPDNKYTELTTTQIIQKSHNLGIINIGERLSKKELWNMLYNLGFSSPVNILPDLESSGILKHYKQWYLSDKRVVTFGYGPMNATLAQLARAYLVFLNHGSITELKIIKNNDKKSQFNKVFKEEATAAVVKMLDATVSDVASGYAAQIKNYDVAGKTGTTQLLNKNGIGYDKDRHGTFFAGFVPTYKPKYLMLVHINNPKTKRAGGSNIAAPVFQKAMTNILKFK